MRGNTCWNYKPFTRLIDMDIRQKPFICRVAPFETGFDIQWFDNGQPKGAHKLIWRVYLTQDEWQEMPLTGDTARVEGLVEHCDYDSRLSAATAPAKADCALRTPPLCPARWSTICTPRTRPTSSPDTACVRPRSCVCPPAR